MTSHVGTLVQLLPVLQGTWESGFTILFEVLVKGTLLLLFGIALALCLRRASAASRHLVWTLTLGAILALPVLALTLPTWNVPISSTPAPVTANAPGKIERRFPAGPVKSQFISSTPAREPASPAWRGWILLLWASGSIFFIARMAVGEIRVRRLAGRSQLFEASEASSILDNASHRLHINRVVELGTSGEIGVPFTHGVFHAGILLPEEVRRWSRPQLEFVLAHELAHVSRYDCLTQIPAQIACALFWFHPLVWLAAFQMRKERERACDDMVLSLGHPATDYAEFLVTMGRSLRRLNPAWSTSIAMAQSSQLEVRMKALLDSRMNHKPLAATRVLFAAVLAMVLLVPTAAIHAAAPAPQAARQANTGSVTGVVTDPMGARVPHASITLSGPSGNFERRVTTSPSGEYAFDNVPPGSYDLKVEAPGFQLRYFRRVVVGPARQSAESQGKPYARAPNQPFIPVVLNLGRVSQAMVVRAKAPRNMPTEPRSPPVRRIRVGGQVEAAKLIYDTPPKYPEAAKAKGIQGTVWLQAVISAQGKIIGLNVINSPDPALSEAARKAVREWRYKPTLLNGEPVEVATTIHVQFELVR